MPAVPAGEADAGEEESEPGADDEEVAESDSDSDSDVSVALPWTRGRGRGRGRGGRAPSRGGSGNDPPAPGPGLTPACAICSSLPFAVEGPPAGAAAATIHPHQAQVRLHLVQFAPLTHSCSVHEQLWTIEVWWRRSLEGLFDWHGGYIFPASSGRKG